MAGTQTIAQSRAEDARHVPGVQGDGLASSPSSRPSSSAEPSSPSSPFRRSPRSSRLRPRWPGMTALLVAAAFVEAFPVPIENVPVGGTSLATVFIVGTAVDLRLGAGDRRWPPDPAARGGDPAPAGHPGPLQQLGLRARGRGGRRRLHGDPGRGLRLACGRGRARVDRLLRGEHPARRRRRQPLGPRRVRLAPPPGALLDVHRLRDHGLADADAGRAVGALALPLGRARRSARRHRALPALRLSGARGDAARAHRSAHRPRQPSPLPRAARPRPRRGGAEGPAAERLPARHRQLQGGQ